LRLAFCLIKYFPYGGLQRSFFQIAQECLGRGHDVHVLTTEWRGTIPPGLAVEEIKVRGLTNHRRRVRLAQALRERVRRQPYDGVVGFSKMPGLDIYYGGDSCFAAFVCQRHPLYRLTGRCRTYLALESAVFKPSSRTHALLLARPEIDHYRRHYGTPSERLHLLPPGIARDRVAPPDAAAVGRRLRTELGIPSHHKVLLMVGSGFRTKGVDRTMRAVAALPRNLRHQITLMVVGHDNFRPFQRLARRLAVDAQLLFFHGRNDIPRFLFAADLLVHPAYRETTGTILVEALAAGLPVLASDVCGFSHHVARAAGGCLVASPFDQSAFNDLMADMLESPLRAQWRRNGIRYVQQTDVFSRAQRAVDLIERLRA
jgi:UDP-glucose:(heptosyl)LPS alpha-1,3-glucosyltransferase